jgi:hypothetical protein
MKIKKNVQKVLAFLVAPVALMGFIACLLTSAAVNGWYLALELFDGEDD